MLLFYNSYFEDFGLNLKGFMIAIAFMIVGVAIGSKTLFVITEIPSLIGKSFNEVCIAVAEAGFVFYGGLAGAFAGVWCFARVFKLSYRDLIENFVVGFPLFHGIARIGCFLAGCCYGVVWPWGFPVADDPGNLHLPIQLIESGVDFWIFWKIRKFRTDEAYSATYAYLRLYGSARFMLEFFRGDAIRGVWFGLSTSQWISLVLVLYGHYKQYKDLDERGFLG
jgi:phosphatidylglycerol:prolipoprotein diacylglycerol transferase